MKISSVAILTALAVPAAAEIYFKEQFNDKGWTKRWKESTKWKPKTEMGKFKQTCGKYYADESDLGIQTSEDSRFYGISAPLEKTYTSSPDKPLVIQYTVKHEQKLDCAGAYLKLLPGGKKFDAAKFGGDTPYAVMFGPDMCGHASKKTHVILHSHTKDENLQIKHDVPTETDNLSHLFTLVIQPNNTFEVFIDEKSVRDGTFEDAFDVSEPKQIDDPEAKKPDDWVDQASIPDPEDKKPDGWDDIPKEIPDPDATKPEDWDDEDDGVWEPPMMKNPEYKGEWKQKVMLNPDYKGKWEAPKIDNPAYKYDPEMYMVCKDGCTHVGFELWQVTSGTIFDDILITDSLEEAQAFAKETFFKKKDGEKAMYDKQKEAEMEAEKEAEKASQAEGMGGMDMDMDGMSDEF